MKYVIGLDIGIASVGWSVVDVDNAKILGLGVRTFNKAEEPKTGASLAEPRRIARGARRRIARRAERLKLAKDLLVSSGLVSEQRKETAFRSTQNSPSPWDLRLKGLDFLLTGEEFARALFHIVKRRGFKSNRKSQQETSKDDTAMLGSISQNRKILEEGGYCTVGEMVAKHPDFADKKRNTEGSYSRTFSRSMLEDEIKTLIARQQELGSTYATAELAQQFLEIFNWQKPFASGDDILKKIGDCTFIKGELRAPKRCYTVEKFDMLHSINTKLRWTTGGSDGKITPQQLSAIAECAHTTEKISYARIRKLLELPEDAKFVLLSREYSSAGKGSVSAEDAVKKAEKKSLSFMPGYHSIRKVCSADGTWDAIMDDADALDNIGYALTIYKNEPEIHAYLQECSIPDAVIYSVLKCGDFAKTSNLSLKAIKKILPFMEEGQQYHEACESAGYNHALSRQTEALRGLKLPRIDSDDVRNPVVYRALTQSRKVINAIINRFGCAPYRVHIELARDMGRSYQDRKEIEKLQKDNEADRKRNIELFKSTFKTDQEPITIDILKFRLYNQQHGKCMYSLRPLDIHRLLEPNYVEIDHILPRSRSFDDSMNNKALVLSSENQNKGNRTPFEFFGHNEVRWQQFEVFVKSTYLPFRKKNNLLRKVFDEKAELEWRSRNLNDTRYITRFLSNYIRENLAFNNKEGKQTVFCPSGQLVSKVRGLWGLNKVREENDLHHALDATVVACLSPGQQHQLTRFYQRYEAPYDSIDLETGEVLEGRRPRLPMPWDNFRRELLALLSDNPAQELAKLDLPAYTDEEKAAARPVTVSRMPMRTFRGEIHAETIRSAKRVSTDGVSTVRKPLTSLTAGDLNNLSNPEANAELYAEIRRRMEENSNNAQKAFEEPLYKPNAKKPTLVKRVTVMQTQKTGVPVRQGLADNSTMVRTDIFKKNGKYYLVPVYLKDILAGVLPNLAVVAHKTEDEWLPVDESQFVTSLYPYDLFYLDCGKTEGLFYYRGCDRATGALTFMAPNSTTDKLLRQGIQSAKGFVRYEMGMLGDYHRVRKQEVRRGLENRRSSKCRKTEVGK